MSRKQEQIKVSEYGRSVPYEGQGAEIDPESPAFKELVGQMAKTVGDPPWWVRMRSWVLRKVRA